MDRRRKQEERFHFNRLIRQLSLNEEDQTMEAFQNQITELQQVILNLQGQIQQLQNAQPAQQYVQQAQQNVNQNLKIPDEIKGIIEYKGDKSSLFQWTTYFRSVMEATGLEEDDPQYIRWLNYIRQKITGPANEALVQRNLPISLNNIINTLVEFFGDPRDMETLTQEIPYLKQGNRRVLDYYQQVLELNTEINNKVRFSEKYEGGESQVIAYIENQLITAFMDGLNENISVRVWQAKPQSLLDAFNLAMKAELTISRINEKNMKMKTFAGEQSKVSNYKNAPRSSQNMQANNKQGNFQRQQNVQQNSQANFYRQQNFQQGEFQQRQQNQAMPPRQQNANGNFQRQQYQQNVQRGNFNQQDASMRSRKTEVPMSGISYGSNLHNIELEETPQECEGFVMEEEEFDTNFCLETPQDNET